MYQAKVGRHSAACPVLICVRSLLNVMKRPLLEVCVGSFADARIADVCGVERVELNSALQMGGLTPSPATLLRTLQQCSLQVIAMARPRPGGFCYDDDHWETLLGDTQWMLEQGVHGIAFGCLNADRTIDSSRVKQMRKLAGGRQLVFHRAFDLVDDWQAGLETLIDAGVDRVMTSGGAESVPDGLERIRQISERSANRIEIIPAGGVTPSNLAEILKASTCYQIHGSFSSPMPDPGYEDASFRFSPVDQFRATNRAKLEQAIAVLNKF